MAIKTKQQILDTIKEHFPDDTSDSILSLIEDVTDTITDYENKTKDSTDWKKKYDENDKMWRDKYKSRFFSAKDDDEDGEDVEDDETPKALTYDDLFKEESK